MMTLASRILKILATGFVVVLLILLGYSAYEGFSQNTGANAAIGGPFSLTDQNGNEVTNRNFRGRWQIIYFGYTRCPDACPTALNNIANALDAVGSKRDRIVPIFVTVDPARDTAKVLKDYLGNFGAEFVGLTGSDVAIATTEQEFHVYAAKRPEANGNYDMDHSSTIYIMDPNGRFVTNFTDDSDPNLMATRLKVLIGP